MAGNDDGAPARYVGYPYAVRPGGTATVDEAAHARQLIEQLLFTSPGQRVNRPTLGGGLLPLLFGPMSEELLAATQFQVQGALQQWLGDRIRVNEVRVDVQQSRIHVLVTYQLVSTGELQQAVFTR